MTSDQLVEWIKETERRNGELPEALALLHEQTGLSFREMAALWGGHGGTVYKRVRRARPAPPRKGG